MNPSRRVRLHRHIAETIARLHSADAAEHAAELAYQYHRSAALPGVERGVVHALAAADRAEVGAAWDEAAMYLRIALELMPGDSCTAPERA